MSQRFLVLICCGFLLNSCDFFQKKEFVSDTVIDTIIDYKSVDVFPLYPACDSIPSIEKQKICSQIKLSENIYASLLNHKIVSVNQLNDTLFIKLKIDAYGKVTLSNIVAGNIINRQIPNLDSILKDGLGQLPVLKPAIKRGIPVTTEFTLPIVVKG